jgi:hypothetical protein
LLQKREQGDFLIMYRLYLMIASGVCICCFASVSYAHINTPTDYKTLELISSDYNLTHNPHIKNTPTQIITLAGRRAGRRLRLRYRRK